jgi:hypothetical protein
VIEAVAKTIAELTSQQDGFIRQQVIEQLMQQILHYDGEFRREEATSAANSSVMIRRAASTQASATIAASRGVASSACAPVTSSRRRSRR